MFSVSAEAPSSQETRKRVSRRQGVAAKGRAINCLTGRNYGNPALNAERRPMANPPPLTQRGPNRGNRTRRKPSTAHHLSPFFLSNFLLTPKYFHFFFFLPSSQVGS